MKKEVMREERRLAFLMIAWRMPEIFTSLAAAVASASMAVWLEFVENVSVMIPAILLAVLSGKLRHNLKYSYNYGTGKLEAITAFACEIFDLTGLFCILFFSIRQFFRPSGEEKKLVFALCMSLVGLGIDVFLLLRQRQLLHDGDLCDEGTGKGGGGISQCVPCDEPLYQKAWHFRESL